MLGDLNKLRQTNKEGNFRNKQNKESEQGKLQALEAKNRKLERQRNELFTVFKKQLKLIEVGANCQVLKKQKMHLEAAQLFKFTEDEFISALDVNIKNIRT